MLPPAPGSTWGQSSSGEEVSGGKGVARGAEEFCSPRLI